jgi:hypothetical protein
MNDNEPGYGGLDPDRPDPRDVEKFFAEDVEAELRRIAPRPLPTLEELHATRKLIAVTAINLAARNLTCGDLEEAERFLGMAERNGHPLAQEFREDFALLSDALIDDELDQLTAAPDCTPATGASERVAQAARRLGDRLVAAAQAYAEELLAQAHAEADRITEQPTPQRPHAEEGHDGQ